MASAVRSAGVAAQLSLEENMRRIRLSFMILIAIAFVLNGWGLLQHLSMLPSHDGFIAAVLIANMLSIPAIVWAAFVFGEVAESDHLRGSRAKRLRAS
jgi:hypothetical protein